MLETIRQYRIIPVAAVENVDDGLRLCETLTGAGLPVMEITFRTAAAEDVIKAAVKQFPDTLIGAGTVLNTVDLQRAIDAGARFAVSPGLNPEVVRAAMRQKFPFFPGVLTPSDIEQAVALGCTALKFFPAEAAGGVKLLKSLIGPYGHLGIEFSPTGGINAGNFLEYLALPQVFAVGGTWIAAKKLLGDWKAIAALAREALALVEKA